MKKLMEGVDIACKHILQKNMRKNEREGVHFSNSKISLIKVQGLRILVGEEMVKQPCRA